MENRNSSLADVYQENFIDECLGGQCEIAVQNLVSSMNGNPGLFGCDLMQILFNGDTRENDFYQGWRDVVATKSAYVLSLIS